MSLNLLKYGKFSRLEESGSRRGACYSYARAYSRHAHPGHFWYSCSKEFDGVYYRIIVFRELNFFMRDAFKIRIIYSDAFKEDTFLEGRLDFGPGPISFSDIEIAIKQFFKKNNIQAEFDF